MNNKIIFDSYIMYGLNRRRSFLRVSSCEGCGGKQKVMLESDEELLEFSTETLKTRDCMASALFYVMKDGTYKTVFRVVCDEDEEEDLVEFAIGTVRSSDMHMFAELDGEFKFCCYSLLIETDDGEFEVCT